MKFLFQLFASLLTMGILVAVGGVAGLVMLVLLPVALLLGGGLLAAFIVIAAVLLLPVLIFIF